MACGEYGEGKMTEPESIITFIEKHFKNIKSNKKFKALVTAGPTLEYIDPVRYITNKSSGKQGYEIAKSLCSNGFETTLISGPTNLKLDSEINFIKVTNADEMFKETLNHLPADVAIFSAAVSDWKIKNIANKKIKKNPEVNLKLETNIDILKYISNHNSLRPKLVIGFAAETDDVEMNAKKKLDEKNCDWIIANDVSDRTIGFGSDLNEVTIFYKNDEIEKITKMSKTLLAEKIVEKVISKFN